jgi:hypothetical protein
MRKAFAKGVHVDARMKPEVDAIQPPQSSEGPLRRRDVHESESLTVRARRQHAQYAKRLSAAPDDHGQLVAPA